jgi:hypothetical protein
VGWELSSLVSAPGDLSKKTEKEGRDRQNLLLCLGVDDRVQDLSLGAHIAHETLE